MSQTRHRQRGWMLIEVIVGLGVMGMLMVGFAVGLDGLRRFNRYQWTKQQCIAAAQAQLDSVAFTRRPIDPCDMGRLWPKVEVTVGVSEGQGQWAGLSRVDVKAEAQCFTQAIHVTMSRYVQGSGEEVR